MTIVQQLINNKKYESAMKLLQCADSNVNRPDYVIAKTELVLNYFVTSIMHQFFALKDLKPNEEKSLTLYKDKNLKSDAARMLGVIYFERKDYVFALKYFRKADKILPDDFSGRYYMLYC